MEGSATPWCIIYCQKFHPPLYWRQLEHPQCPVLLLWFHPSSLSRVVWEVEGFPLLGFVFTRIFNRSRSAVHKNRWEITEPHLKFCNISASTRVHHTNTEKINSNESKRINQNDPCACACVSHCLYGLLFLCIITLASQVKNKKYIYKLTRKYFILVKVLYYTCMYSNQTEGE